MPLFYQQNINAHTRLAVWKIEEQTDFFLVKVPAHRAVTHPHKQLQHLAGRYLLVYLFPDFPLADIEIADTRKPFLPNEQYHFSISHCGDFAAAIVSKNQRVGIDIESTDSKAFRLADKFINAEEKLMLGELSPILATTVWSAKEVLFKWYAAGQVDFKKHLSILEPIQLRNNNSSFRAIIKKEQDFPLTLHAQHWHQLVLVYTYN